jgi:hypothetical protein
MSSAVVLPAGMTAIEYARKLDLKDADPNDNLVIRDLFFEHQVPGDVLIEITEREKRDDLTSLVKYHLYLRQAAETATASSSAAAVTESPSTTETSSTTSGAGSSKLSSRVKIARSNSLDSGMARVATSPELAAKQKPRSSSLDSGIARLNRWPVVMLSAAAGLAGFALGRWSFTAKS